MPDSPPISPADLALTNFSLAEHIEQRVNQYFFLLGEENLSGSHDLYHLLMTQFEKPLLNAVYQNTHGNQSQMAQILGLNRGTLRKKLKTHGLIA